MITIVVAGDGITIRQLKDLEPGETCFAIGTVFKDMSLRPSTIKEISENVSIDSCQNN